MKNNKKVTTLILVLMLMIAGIVGGTLAYWQWITATEQETLVNVSLTDDATIYIDFPENEITNMYPTSDCEVNGTSSWVTEITVNNGTGVVLSPKFKLKVKIEDKNGEVITNSISKIDGVYANAQPNRYYIKYAVTEEDGVCSKPLFSGRFDQDVMTFSKIDSTHEKYSEKDHWYDSGYITKFDDETSFPVVSRKENSGVSFFAAPNGQTKQKFKVWVWLSDEYVSVTQGTESSDMMQDAKVTVSWSENSELEQVQREYQGEAIAIFSLDDMSLRFYREENPSSVTVGSTYNGRVVTEVYTGFETAKYTSISAVPWNNLPDETIEVSYGDLIPGTDGLICGVDSGNWYDSYINETCEFEYVIRNVVFEDYIYPVSTAYWFSNLTLVSKMDVRKLDTSNVTNMEYMFYGTGILLNSGWGEIIGLDAFDTSKVINMNYMFNDFSLEGASISGWNVCNVKYYDEIYTSSMVNGYPHFEHPKLCSGEIKGSAYAVYSSDDDSLRFYRSENPITVGSTYNGRTVSYVSVVYENELTGWTFEESYFEGEEMPDGTICNDSEIGYCDFQLRDVVKKIVFEDYVYPICTDYLFANFKNIELIDLEKLDTSGVTNMMSMFSGTNFIGSLSLDHFDTSKVTDMAYMFSGVDGEVLNIENWDVSNVEDMSYMFYNAQIPNTDLSKWKVCKISTRPDNFSNLSTIIEPNFGMTC